VRERQQDHFELGLRRIVIAAGVALCHAFTWRE